MRLVVLALLTAVALGSAASATGADSEWNERDFRLRTIEASLGDSEASFVEFNGTMTQQARGAGLHPHIRFTAQTTVTCVQATDPTMTLTRAGTLDSRHDNLLVTTSGVEYSRLDAGTIKWTARFTFEIPADEFWSFYLCQVPDYVVRDVVVTRVTGITWLSVMNLSPMPGTTLYQYDVPAGESVLRFSKDGVSR